MPSNTQLYFSWYTQSKHINAYFLCRDRHEWKYLCGFTCHVTYKQQVVFFPYHPWWRHWWDWAETRPGGPAPHHAVSLSAGAESLCWAGPSKVPDASSAASVPGVPSVDHTGERKRRGTSLYVYWFHGMWREYRCYIHQAAIKYYKRLRRFFPS